MKLMNLLLTYTLRKRIWFEYPFFESCNSSDDNLTFPLFSLCQERIQHSKNSNAQNLIWLFHSMKSNKQQCPTNHKLHNLDTLEFSKTSDNLFLINITWSEPNQYWAVYHGIRIYMKTVLKGDVECYFQFKRKEPAHNFFCSNHCFVNSTLAHKNIFWCFTLPSSCVLFLILGPKW